ncbi:MAG: flagella basal body P-ring formation protein FlgA [Syntrophus sp. (in: bacteria)]|nr:flagella basal body P-ring formation protein FlgA [Syntrophus sp. (in: bacteria)]
MKKLQRLGSARTRTAAFAFALMPALLFLAPVPANAKTQIHESIREYIETNMPWPQGTARVEFISPEPEIPTRSKDMTLRIEPAGNADFIGDAAFVVRMSADGKFIRTETVRTRIEVLRDIVVAAKQIRSGAVLTEHDIRLTKKWVRRNMPDVLSCPEDAIGKRITAPARPGMELSTPMLKDAPLVHKGKMVRVLFDNGSLRITTIGIPEEDGTAGNMVRVRNVTSNKVIYARVLGESLVGIDL